MNATKSVYDRRDFLKAAGLSASVLALDGCLSTGSREPPRQRRPNVVFVFADQWRGQAAGYAGDPNAITPNLDRLAAESVDMTNAVSGCPVCCPYRASLMTGRYPLSHGVFLNDVPLHEDAMSVARIFTRAGYETAYIGKWHLNGRNRGARIPEEKRLGFDYWKVMGCTHNYNLSRYYEGDEQRKSLWRGYDAIAQTRDARRYIAERARKGRPFLLFLSFGPPHNPYQTAPLRYKEMYRADGLALRPNVPERLQERARRDLAGYYAHITALDDCMGDLLRTIRDEGIEEDTLLVFTSDHGDMLGSQGMQRKQKPWDESIRVPFLLRYPGLLGRSGTRIDMPFNTPDILPTLLGLSGIAVPGTVEGTDFSKVLRGVDAPFDEAALIACISPFGEWPRGRGREYRGVRTRDHTYVEDLDGPWLFYDNRSDPYQLDNLAGRPGREAEERRLREILAGKLKETRDDFLEGDAYTRKWGYEVDGKGTVPYTV